MFYSLLLNFDKALIDIIVNIDCIVQALGGLSISMVDSAANTIAVHSNIMQHSHENHIAESEIQFPVGEFKLEYFSNCFLVAMRQICDDNGESGGDMELGAFLRTTTLSSGLPYRTAANTTHSHPISATVPHRK